MTARIHDDRNPRPVGIRGPSAGIRVICGLKKAGRAGAARSRQQTPPQESSFRVGSGARPTGARQSFESRSPNRTIHGSAEIRRAAKLPSEARRESDERKRESA